MVRVEGILDPEAGAAVIAAIEPLATKLGAEDDRSAPQRRADALATLCQAALGFDDLLPDFNGDRPHLDVITRYETLLDDLDPHASYDPTGAPTINGTRVSPQTARRLACDADILPVVMNSNSEVLDIGRTTRTWPKAIRKALRIEDLARPPPPMENLARSRHPQDQRRPGRWPTGAHACPFRERIGA